MFPSTFHSQLKNILLAGAALSLAACGGSGSYRVASVGSVAQTDGGSTADTGSDGAGTTGSGSSVSTGTTAGTSGTGSTGGTGSSGSTGTKAVGRVLVTAGNTVIGASSKHNALATKINGLAPGTTQITGTVTTVLRKSGQSLVDLGNGQSLILNGAGGKLGEIVKIDLLSRTVTGASSGSRLLGVSVLSPTVASGSVAAVNAGNSGPLLTVGSGTGSTPSGALAPVKGVLAPVNGVLAPVTGGVTGSVTGSTGTTGATGHVTGVVGGTLGGLKGGH